MMYPGTASDQTVPNVHILLDPVAHLSCSEPYDDMKTSMPVNLAGVLVDFNHQIS